MKYTKKDFGRDLFFWIGFLDGAIEKHNKTTKNKLNVKRFEEFEKYCFKRFSDKDGRFYE